MIATVCVSSRIMDTSKASVCSLQQRQSESLMLHHRLSCGSSSRSAVELDPLGKASSSVCAGVIGYGSWTVYYTATTTRNAVAFGDEEWSIVQDIATEFGQIVS